jgi:hypothetical protein
MFTLFLLCLIGWSATLLFMAWQLWVAPEAYEDESGFHLVERPASRWRHVAMSHRRRSHRTARQHSQAKA